MGNVKWTKREEEKLSTYYPDNGCEYCKRFLPNKTLRQIQGKTNRLRLKRIKKDTIFSNEETEILKNFYPKHGLRFCFNLIKNKTKKQIQDKATTMGLKREGKRRIMNFTNEDDQIIKQYYPKHGYIKCIEFLKDKTRNQIQKRAHDLKIKTIFVYKGYNRLKKPNSHRGIGGYLDGVYFRSLPELSYMITLNRFEINYKTESDDLFIEYYFNGKKRKYYPDFLIANKYLIEIKPIRFRTEEKNLIKFEAARDFCKENGLIYKIIIPKILFNKIVNLYRQGHIKFNHFFFKKFVKSCKKAGFII